MTTVSAERLATIFVEVADTLVDECDLIELLPENPDFKTIVVEPGEPFELEGLAVGLIRNTMLM